jgi:hypothetical protein
MPNKFLIVCGGAGRGLLLQRETLGVDGELQIDVREEIHTGLLSRPQRSECIRLDLPVGTTQRVLVDGRKRIKEGIISDPAYVRHTDFLARYWPGSEQLKDGLARAPAIGGLTIRHESNLRELNSKLKTMLFSWAIDVGVENPIEVWIVSSTCGGTGEGIHRFVGETLTRLLTSLQGSVVTINFVRVGQSTYRAVDVERTALNTFLGVAADAAFKIKLPRDFPGVGVTTNWYYLEIPPAGVGPAAVPHRERLVEVASKALMLDELTDSLGTIIVNDHIGLVRIGHWGQDFEQRVKYSQTLVQVIRQLTALLEPDYETYLSGEVEPSFESGQLLEDVLDQLRGSEAAAHILNRMEREGWQFPKYGERRQPRDPRRMDDHLGKWIESIDALIAPRRVADLQLEFITIKTRKDVEDATQEPSQYAEALGVAPMDRDSQTFSPGWFDKVENAHSVTAWAQALLGTSSGEIGSEGLYARLHGLARECSSAQHRFSIRAGSAERAEELAQHLPAFVETLAKVVHLRALERAATRLLEVELGSARDVLEFARSEEAMVRGAIEGSPTSPVVAAHLSEQLDKLTGRSWLADLVRSVDRKDRDGFEKEVLKGATGLTRVGLETVLGLRRGADVSEIRSALREHVGQMYDPDGEVFQAQWWQAIPPDGVQQTIQYRILPILGDGLQQALGDRDQEIKYLYAGLGTLGLTVLAFEGVMISTPGDQSRTPRYLMEKFLPEVQTQLAGWVDGPFGVPTGKLRIASAGVGGEPLYEPAMRAAGLTDHELERLSEFFTLYTGEE